MKWTATIHTEPASKANSRQVTRGGMVIKSKKAQAYTKAVRTQLNNPVVWDRKLKAYVSNKDYDPGRPTLSLKPDELFTEKNLKVTMKVWYASWRPDLDPSLLFDLLERHVYLNDRCCVEHHIIRMPKDAENPRVEVTVEEIEVPWAHSGRKAQQKQEGGE